MRSAGREVGAAASALGAYLATVLPRGRRQLRRLQPLPAEKARNAEAVAVFATLAARARRAAVVRAIVALQVAIDLRDELEETGGSVDRVTGDCLDALEMIWRHEVMTLPAHAVVSPFLERAVARCEEGQRRTHAAAAQDPSALRSWAEGQDAPAGYRWWEVAAGASSSVAAHALIAAAADPGTTAETAALIDAAYHPSIGALTVLLDDLVDLEADRAAGEHSYIAYYASRKEAVDRLGLIADRGDAALGDLPRAGRHRAILAGVVAFYVGAPEADTELGRGVRRRLLTALGPGTRVLTGFTSLSRFAERKRPG